MDADERARRLAEARGRAAARREEDQERALARLARLTGRLDAEGVAYRTFLPYSERDEALCRFLHPFPMRGSAGISWAPGEADYETRWPSTPLPEAMARVREALDVGHPEVAVLFPDGGAAGLELAFDDAVAHIAAIAHHGPGCFLLCEEEDWVVEIARDDGFHAARRPRV